MPPRSEPDLSLIAPHAKTQAQALAEFLWALFCCGNDERNGVAAEPGRVERAGKSFFGQNNHYVIRNRF
jgi:hypothetical protein